MEVEVSFRLNDRARIMRGLTQLWKNRGFSVAANMEKLEGIVVPSLLYGSDSWMRNITKGRRGDVFGMEYLIRTLGVSNLESGIEVQEIQEKEVETRACRSEWTRSF